MEIQVYGSGCPKCKKLYELIQQAIDELDIKIKVEYITDIQKIVEMGFMLTPETVVYVSFVIIYSAMAGLIFGLL